MKDFELNKTLGLPAVTFIPVGFMVGGGVFVFTAISLGISGESLPLAYGLAGIPVFISMMPLVLFKKVHPYLFQAFPELEKKIAFVPPGKFPTPVMKLEGCSGKNLWVKRYDLDSDVYGGNKVRKLEFILADVLRRGKKGIITFGGIGTMAGLSLGCAMALTSKKWHIKLDPTYTAKTFAAFMDCAGKPEYSGKNLLYWHTYNSADLSSEADSVKNSGLHRCLSSLLGENEVPCD